MRLPEEYLDRMRGQLCEAFPAYMAALDAPCRRALRVNTLKTDADFLKSALPGLVPTGLAEDGFFVPENFSPSRDPLHAAGLYYMQEPSAQVPATLFDFTSLSEAPVVLDLCAAPGGKSSQLAARMRNRGLLIANEPNAQRAETLCRTFERLGVSNAIAVSMLPDALCPLIANLCDAVLVDAPCSGEGMFRKEPQAVADWSAAHVSASALRQSGILNAAALAVRPGGTLVYSTCTFSPEENESVIERFLFSHGDFTLQSTVRLYPHTCGGEGQFAARLTKSYAGDARRAGLVSPENERIPAFDRFLDEQLAVRPEQKARLLPDGRVVLLPELLPEALPKMHVRVAGVPAGEKKGERFEPAHALFLALPAASFRRTVPLENEKLLRYLSGEALPADGLMKGYAAVTYRGFPLGFVKSDGQTLKNHYPKGLRLR